MTRYTVVLALLLAACNTGEDLEATPVVIGNLVVTPPPGWTPQELGTTTRVWTPEENPRRESITVIIGPRVVGGAEPAFAAARTAQGLLRDARVVGAKRFTSPGGLAGLQLDVRFRPDAVAQEVYERRHVVLFGFDGDRVVHLLYTAARPDPTWAALTRVLGSLRVGGAS